MDHSVTMRDKLQMTLNESLYIDDHTLEGVATHRCKETICLATKAAHIYANQKGESYSDVLKDWAVDVKDGILRQPWGKALGCMGQKSMPFFSFS